MIDDMVGMLDALGHAERLHVFRVLVRRYPQSIAAGELAETLGYKRSTLSIYLSVLRRAGLVHQDREGNSLLYSADLAGAKALTGFLSQDCCRGRTNNDNRAIAFETNDRRTFNVLFVCTRNSARSIFAEVILRDSAPDRFVTYSAGTSSDGTVHPMTLQVLKENGHATSGLQAISIAEFQKPAAPRMDFVFTVCDQAANEECPVWPGQPVTAHWGHPDPAAGDLSDDRRLELFRQTYQAMSRRIQPFAGLQGAALDRAALQNKVDDIGRLQLV
ncbi:arsenate reductase/protein-tyrosine-phosphatase family protein [Martelella soudanensis]|uniref:arsenate reductase/protein-tyrosine-phosphatase family protein n=1 Tax=unclassified Martelella TaxID=2629616 RepID=UPI001FEEF42B|nr:MULTISPECIES: helix-turn-helix domain-containing protein [unclassified Martelella]